MGQVVIEADEWVTCTAGHRICRCAKTQHRGEWATVAAFDNWAVKAEPGKIMPDCSCGQPFTQSHALRGVRLHVEGRGWSS